MMQPLDQALQNFLQASKAQLMVASASCCASAALAAGNRLRDSNSVCVSCIVYRAPSDAIELPG